MSARDSRLAARGARSGGLVLAGSIATFATQFVALLVLSRLLSPEDFGLVAMVSVFVGLGTLLRDFGLPLAGLQERVLTRQQASNLFWMSAVVSTVCAIALALSAQALVVLFNEPRLMGIVPALSIVVFLGGISAQLQVQLARRMQFGSLVGSDIIGQAAALGTAVLLAFWGAGYWALVAQAVIAAVITLAYRWIASRWLPSLPRRGHDSFRLFRTGAIYGVAQLLTFAQSNIDTVIIGSQLGAQQLGYYNRAYQLLTAPASRLLDPLTQVVVTTLNRAKVDKRDPDTLLRKIQFGVGALVVCLFAVTAGTAPGLIPVVLGQQWEASIPVFQILAIGGSIWVFNHVSYWAFIVHEKPRALLHYNLLSKPLSIICILVGSQFGLTGVAWGYVVAMALSWPLNLVWLRYAAQFPSAVFFFSGCRILVAGAVGGAGATFVFHAADGAGDLLGIAAGIVVGTVLMLATLASMTRSRELLLDWLRLMRASFSRTGKP